MRKIKQCAACHETREIWAREQCHPCYQRIRRKLDPSVREQHKLSVYKWRKTNRAAWLASMKRANDKRKLKRNI